MLPAAEAEATFATLLPDFTDSARLLPELPSIVVELLHQGHSPLLHALRATNLAPAQHRLLVRALTELRHVSLRNGNYRVAGYLLEHLAELLQSKPALDAADLTKLFGAAGLQGEGPKASDFQGHTSFTFLQRWLAQLDKLGRTAALPPDLTARLQKLLLATDGVAMGAYYAKDLGRLRTRAQALLSQHSPAGLAAVHFDGGDAFGQNLNAFSAGLSPTAAATQPWLHLLLALTQASGGRPTPKFAKVLAAATAALGPDTLRQQASQWLALLASLPLPAHGLRAEFWVSEVNTDGAWNDTGIYNYVSTDQVRFVRGLDEVLPLPEVPPLAFSEVMRDVDLFVGVASVGNDPLWRDNGGLAQYRNYWESYSFGELGEVAKSRKAVLERLVPRLKIGKVSEIRSRFLVVEGKRRTYKIHLGSGNILMEPNDQYLCIVPDRSAKNLTANVFLPFEGDAVLSIILSKALLLMDDDKITDETILRQIG